MLTDPRLICLIDEIWRRFEAAQGDERATLTLTSKVQKALGVNGDDLMNLLEKSGYIQKAAVKDDPPPGPLVRLPLADALREVSIELVEASPTVGLLLRCLRCGGLWRPAGYRGGDLKRPAKNFWMCARGCNASAGPLLWDEGKPPTYNPLADYQQR